MKLSKRLEAIKSARDRTIHNSTPTPAPVSYKPVEGEAIFNLATPASSPGKDENGLVKFSFAGYSGQPVSLRDYGYEYPMIYNISGMEHKNSIPLLFEHWEPIGHSTSIVKINSSVSGEGVGSYPSTARDTVTEALANGFPFEASMGLRITNKEDITFLKHGVKRTINNREVTGPMYVAERSILKEMTITMSGRDSDTNFGLLNKEAQMLLKNSTPAVTPPEVPAVPPAAPAAPAVPPAPPAAPLQNTAPTTPVVPPAPAAPVVSRAEFARLSRLMNSYPDHAESIETQYAAGTDLTAIENSIKLKLFENGLPQVPNLTPQQRSSASDEIVAQFALSCNISPETIAKHVDKKVLDNCLTGSRWSFVETLVNLANSNERQRRFTGFSDVDILCSTIKTATQQSFLGINNSGFSMIDMPNLLKKVTSMMLEERWAINTPFAVQYLKEESNKDFRITQRIRPGGGKIWDEMKNDGKIEETEFGKETEYRSKLSTSAQLVVFNREDIINDDMGVIADMLDAMVEGALIVPDMKLGKLMLVKAAAANSFWVDADNSRQSLALNRANLSTAYNAVRQYNENRGKNFVNLINDRWVLITSITGEETAFELLKQSRIVQETGAASPSKTGEANYWFGKLDQITFPQMSNSSLLGSGTFVSENTWLLWPKSQRFSPYSITYLRGQRRPTIEAVDLPANMLGVGTRGYWDIEINEREREAVLRANG
jgi:hypothetical protein